MGIKVKERFFLMAAMLPWKVAAGLMLKHSQIQTANGPNGANDGVAVSHRCNRRKYRRLHSAQNHEREIMKKLFLFLLLFLLAAAPSSAQTQLLGSNVLQSGHDTNGAGQSEAFPFTATASGSLSSLSFYVDSSSTAKTLILGVYADNAGHVGALLSQGSLNASDTGQWNAVQLGSQIQIVSGSNYWIALMGLGGTIAFRDSNSSSTCHSVESQTGLTVLPSSFIEGAFYNDCPLSAYGLSSPPPPPPPANIVLTASGSVKFDDGTTVYTGAVGVSQLNGTAWVKAGSVNSDVNGVLTGSLIINPDLAVNGVITLQFSIPVVGSTSLALPLLQFRQGATAVTLTSVLYKSVLLPKSFTLAVMP
jgi:hypothetical protein